MSLLLVGILIVAVLVSTVLYFIFKQRQSKYAEAEENEPEAKENIEPKESISQISQHADTLSLTSPAYKPVDLEGNAGHETDPTLELPHASTQADELIPYVRNAGIHLPSSETGTEGHDQISTNMNADKACTEKEVESSFNPRNSEIETENNIPPKPPRAHSVPPYGNRETLQPISETLTDIGTNTIDVNKKRNHSDPQQEDSLQDNESKLSNVQQLF